MRLAAVFWAVLAFIFVAPDAELLGEHGDAPGSAGSPSSHGPGCGLEDHAAVVEPLELSPDFCETYPDGSLPEIEGEPERATAGLAGPIAPAAGQPQGALTGRIVYTSGGHGWQWSGSIWTLDRPLLLEMNEAYGNRDQMNIFAQYAFNAGATVVPMRPVGFQPNEVVVDNASPRVIWSGSWNNSTSTVYYGNSGQVPYRWAALSAGETATGTYVPNIPETGFYPVYTWARHGSDRTFQLYRIRHTGGESRVRVPHHMVGNGWVYLGTYYFNAGADADAGAVVISNLQPTPAVGGVVIADAIRFGNGMSNDGSTYPKEDEGARYWVKNSLGVGQSAGIYDLSSYNDISDNVGAPIRMASEMNREATGSLYQRIYLGFHSNATTGNPSTAAARGAIGLYNSNTSRRTPNQLSWAQIVGQEVNNQMVALNPYLEVPWSNRTTMTYGSTFGEINNQTINNEFDATIIEVAFHDNIQDALLLRDPQVRNWIARASYRAILKYMNQYDGVPLNFLPEPPRNVRAIANESGGIEVSWDVPQQSAGSGLPSGYRVYRSSNGYGFGNPVEVRGGASTSVTLTDLPAETPLYFRVAATNAGGESFPSETVGAHRAADPGAQRVLFVNAYERFERSVNIRQTPHDRNYLPPGHDGNSGVIDRVIPRSVNSFDYVVPHGAAIVATGRAFDSCLSEAVGNDQVNLGDYDVVIWAAGQDSVQHESFSSAEQQRVAAYLAEGGALFVSGSDIAYDLDRASGPTASDRSFLRDTLRVRYSQDDAGTYTLTSRTGTLFGGLPAAMVDDGALGIYPVRTPDRILPSGDGTDVPLLYVGGSGGPGAVEYDGSFGGGRVVFLGFPFEAIADAGVREQYLATSLEFLGKTAFERWQEQHFTEAELADPEISGDVADASGDGVPNILKYALNLDPREASREGLPEISVEEDFLTFRYTQSSSATDLAFEVEASDDLVSWRSADGEVEVISRVDEGDTWSVTVRDKTPFPESARRFMRLRVSR